MNSILKILFGGLLGFGIAKIIESESKPKTAKKEYGGGVDENFAKGGGVGKEGLKEFEIFKNGTQQGTVWAKNKKEAENKVFATYGEHREVSEVEEEVKNVKTKTTNKMTKEKSTEPKAKRPLNAWQLHVKETIKLNPDLKLKEVLKIAAKSYKK